MNPVKAIFIISMGLGLVACGGGGSGEGDEAGTSESGSQKLGGDKSGTDVEVATLPSLENAEELLPPGVPSIE